MTVYKDHLWNEPSGICALCGELRGRENPAGQWWCWDATYDFDLEPEDT
jgi:hypothetical protein